MRTALAIIAVLVLPLLASASDWMIDPTDSKIRFKVNNFLISTVEGEFQTFRGTVSIHETDITRSKISVTIDMASVKADTMDLTDKLRSDSYLNVARYPTMAFVTRKIVKSGTGILKVTGDLTLHGVTRKVVLDVAGPGAASKDVNGKMKRGASATTRISRKEFGLTWDELLTAGLDDDIDISIDITLVRK